MFKGVVLVYVCICSVVIVYGYFWLVANLKAIFCIFCSCCCCCCCCCCCRRRCCCCSSSSNPLMEHLMWRCSIFQSPFWQSRWCDISEVDMVKTVWTPPPPFFPT